MLRMGEIRLWRVKSVLRTDEIRAPRGLHRYALYTLADKADCLIIYRTCGGAKALDILAAFVKYVHIVARTYVKVGDIYHALVHANSAKQPCRSAIYHNSTAVFVATQKAVGIPYRYGCNRHFPVGTELCAIAYAIALMELVNMSNAAFKTHYGDKMLVLCHFGRREPVKHYSKAHHVLIHIGETERTRAIADVLTRKFHTLRLAALYYCIVSLELCI